MILHAERLRGLHVDLVRFATEAAHIFEAEFDLAIVSGLRTEAQQAAEYAKGRTVSSGIAVTPACPLGRTVTEAQHAYETAHGRAAALDFCPVIRGRWAWDDSEMFTLVGHYAEGHGLTWGGRWLARDLGHVQVTGWRDLPFHPPPEPP